MKFVVETIEVEDGSSIQFPPENPDVRVRLLFSPGTDNEEICDVVGKDGNTITVIRVCHE